MPVIRHHLAVMGVVFAAGPFHLLKAERQPPTLGGCLQHMNALRQNFFTNAISGDSGDTPGFLHSSSHLYAIKIDFPLIL